jgi:hypothetical protein
MRHYNVIDVKNEWLVWCWPICVSDVLTLPVDSRQRARKISFIELGDPNGVIRLAS